VVKIAVLASFNMDLVMRVERRPEAGETVQGDFAMHLGGKGFNQAVAARRLGAEVAVTGRVGDDDFGRMFLAALDEEGIDRRAVVIDPTAGTGVATIYVEPNGENTIVQSPRANRNVTRTDWNDGFERVRVDMWEQSAFFEDADACIATLETTAGAAAAFAEDYATLAPIAVLNAAPAEPVAPALLKLFQYLVVNEIELTTISGTPVSDLASIREATERIWEPARFRRLEVVVTRGANGAASMTPGHRLSMQGMSVDVADTTGAGDAFCAALAVGLAESRDPRSTSGLGDAMRFANAAGAVVCTKHGAYPSMPHRANVEALIEAQGSSR
jgi:ribokinase